MGREADAWNLTFLIEIPAAIPATWLFNHLKINRGIWEAEALPEERLAD
jgi:hypothetical protein